MSNDITNFLLKALAAIGGIGVIIFTVFRWIGDVGRDRLKEWARFKADESLEVSKKQLELNMVQAERYANEQFEVYLDLWKSLQALQLAGDALWEEVNSFTADAFIQQIHKTEALVREKAIFFDEEDFIELQKVLDTFRAYRHGKEFVLDILSHEMGIEGKLDATTLKAIMKNRLHKEEYEKLLDRIRESFRNRLSKLKTNTAA